MCSVLTIGTLRWYNDRSRIVLDSTSKERIRAEIDQLGTDQRKRIWLEGVFRCDQAVRQRVQRSLALYGYGSPVHEQALRAMSDTDIVNLYRMELYLGEYGHPLDPSYGELALIAPWTVLHHAASGGTRRKWMPMLQQAHDAGILDASALNWYVDRME